jgi:hypothetical protein
MSEALLIKRSVGQAVYLAPSDDNATVIVRALKDGETVHCKIRRPRNPKHHRLAMALLQLCFEHWGRDKFATYDGMYDDIKFKTGHFDIYEMPNGRAVIKFRSLAWEKMDQNSFRQWWDKLLDLVHKEIIPGVGKKEFEAEVYAMIGENVDKEKKKASALPSDWEDSLQMLLEGLRKCKSWKGVDEFCALHAKLIEDLETHAPDDIQRRWLTARDTRYSDLHPINAG